jgi:hypothetical protein
VESAAFRTPGNSRARCTAANISRFAVASVLVAQREVHLRDDAAGMLEPEIHAAARSAPRRNRPR